MTNPEATAIINRAESDLRDDRCISPCWIDVDNATLMWDQDTKSRRWCIVYASAGIPPRPLVNCPGEIRIKAASHIEALKTTAQWAMRRMAL